MFSFDVLMVNSAVTLIIVNFFKLSPLQ